jgi:hypothetical protein
MQPLLKSVIPVSLLKQEKPQMAIKYVYLKKNQFGKTTKDEVYKQ